MKVLFCLVGVSLLVLEAVSQLPPYPGAGCTFDPACFYYAAGCTLSRCPPFNRSTPVTCNQCIEMCKEKQAGEYPYFCRAIAYDCVTKTCDMFGVDETSGGFLVKDHNKFYFKPTLQCKSTPAPVLITTTLAPLQSCPSGQGSRMIAVQDSQFVGITGPEAPGVDAAGCAQACLRNQVPGGQQLDCRSSQFRNGKCILSTSTATAENQLQADPGAKYYQKFCFEANSIASCPEVFDEFPQKVLIGQNRQTVDAQSLQDCVQSCLDAKQRFGFGCNSAAFYYNIKSQNCILNDETHSTRPDLFTEVKDDKVTFIETLCGGPPSPTSGTTVPSVTLAPAPGIITPVPTTEVTVGPIQTTTWIGGDIGAGIRTLGTLPPLRFFEAKKVALKDAFKDSPNSESVCRALVYNGLKKCPIGVISQNNRMRYCVHPVDC